MKSFAALREICRKLLATRNGPVTRVATWRPGRQRISNPLHMLNRMTETIADGMSAPGRLPFDTEYSYDARHRLAMATRKSHFVAFRQSVSEDGRWTNTER